jgi:thiamine pyrophosphate-dependent acetolactate synthase large subunit-like protein
MVSDGGAARLMVELTTTVANKLPVKIVILKKLAS